MFAFEQERMIKSASVLMMCAPGIVARRVGRRFHMTRDALSESKAIDLARVGKQTTQLHIALFGFLFVFISIVDHVGVRVPLRADWDALYVAAGLLAALWSWVEISRVRVSWRLNRFGIGSTTAQ